ncbi:hypothetical protein [Stigmatella aurantiaca]|uniref:Conserved uncharacterized protein n=1 Tax=Stigmatella aurantiaca (strain DW4/3-1) TaxID=378806 RepID=Q08UX9_STIAD|nr:hypothetical protein [Stigmatella aurantiaca]ADO68820.1 conserved uncharacterized protein [Stigmatella aurantiaca DW4/3-1]EAU64279.1 hypothetical protein STIAU_0719 [Stigmatella aurantiaca DW4/3-1]
MHLPLRRSFLAACGAVLVACGDSEPAGEPPPEDPQEQEDPCAPHGHIHREAEGDWCHCDRGYLAPEEQLVCVVDPHHVPREEGEFDFGDDGEHACWHVANGPYASVTASESRMPRVDAFHTLYTVNLRQTAEGSTGTFQFKAFGTGDFIVYLSEHVPLTVHEGTIPVAVIAEKHTTVCTGLQHMAGLELTEGVTYTFTLGPTSLAQLRMVTEYFP